MNNKTKKEITIEMIDKIKENMDNNYQHLEYIRDIICSDNVELNGERFCWNCEYFVAPYGCCGIFGFVTPFQWCEDWSKANEKDIEENKDKIDECCKEDKIKRINKCKGRMRAYKREIDSDFRQILAILDKEEERG